MFRDLSQKLAENAKHLKLRPEAFGEELVKIGFALEGMYGTPGEGGMCPISLLSGQLDLDSDPGFKRALYAYHKPS